MKTRVIEICKNILIVLLICSLLLLSLMALPVESVRSNPWLSKLLRPLAPLLGTSRAELTYVEPAAPRADGIKPAEISLCRSARRTSAVWDADKVDEMFATFSPLLAQIFSETENYAQISSVQLQNAARTDSVYFRYAGVLPAEVIVCQWGNARKLPLGSFDRFLIAAENGNLSLYLCGLVSYRAPTSLPAELLTDLLDHYEEDSSAFCFELELPQHPFSLVSSEKPVVNAYNCSDPTDNRFVETLATALGFNPYAETRYTNAQGTDCFTETGASLEISDSGLVQLTMDNNRYNAPSRSFDDIAATASALTDTMLKEISGAGKLHLVSVTRSGDSTVCQFQYLVNGVPLLLPQPAAAVTFSGTAVTRASVQLYRFVPTGKSLYPLPAAQAAALLPDGSELMLVYSIGPDGALSADWLQ